MGYNYPKYSLRKIGALINSKRLQMNMDIPEASKNLGIDEPRLTKIEDGRAALSSDEFQAIASFLGINFNEITSLESESLNGGFYRKDAPSEDAIGALEKVRELFVELVGQAQLRS